MFCPKCGIENPDNGKFCRGCRANLGNVLAVVEGAAIDEAVGKDSAAELFSTGIRNIVLGFGFLTAGVFLFTMPPRDGIFWLLMMIPGFVLLASGIGRILKSNAMKAETEQNRLDSLTAAGRVRELPPTQTEYVKPQSSIYKTDDLTPEPRSITEATTRNLEVDPKKQ